jgi:Family of unknown function (DUF5681)
MTDVTQPENSNGSVRANRRRVGRPFKPGQSGNPGGRPKGLGHVRELARQRTDAAIVTLEGVMKHGRTDQAKVAAAVALLDRGWGKPLQSVEFRDSAEWQDLRGRLLAWLTQRHSELLDEFKLHVLGEDNDEPID